MTTETITPPNLKMEIYQLIENLPDEKLPEVLGFLKVLHKISYDPMTAEAMPNQSSATNEASPEHPWMKFAGMFADDEDWDEFQAAMAEYRRELDEIEQIEAIEEIEDRL